MGFRRTFGNCPIPFTDSDHALLLFPMKKSTDPVKKNAGPAHILILIFLFLYHAH